MTAPVLAKALRLFHTVRYLRPVQIYGRALHVLRRVKPDHRPPPSVASAAGVWTAPRWRAASLLGPRRFSFLNEEHEVAVASDWNNPSWPRLWIYNLHYFDDLDALDGATRTSWHERLIRAWIDENPAPDGAGWEPYCLSLRIVNWCRWAWRGHQLSAEALQSLATQVRALTAQLELHLLGNHLWANAKALVVAGLFFEGEEADRWLRAGVKVLERELAEQILADGGHFERSPMYHNILTGDVFDLLAADRVAPHRLPGHFRDLLRDRGRKMLEWAQVMSHPDGELSFFNDSARGIAAPLAALQAQALNLGFDAKAAGGKLIHLAQSGYVRASIGPATLLVDVGDIGPDYLPGHAHADTLSCELSLADRRLLVNGGVSTYAAGEQRALERSTASHNTVEVDGEDSSEVWSSFRVARRARPKDVFVSAVDDQLVIGAYHDGYRRLPGQVLHHRRWVLRPDGLSIEDRLTGRFSQARCYWHFHPDVSIRSVPEGFHCTLLDGRQVTLEVVGGRGVVEAHLWAVEFGALAPSLRIAVDFDGSALLTQWRW